MIQQADRMIAFDNSLFLDVVKEKKKWEKKYKKKALDFSLGSPDLAPNDEIIETMKEAVSNPVNYKYAVNELDELDEEIQNWYDKRYDVALKKSEILCLQGSQEALVNLPLALCNPGDLVFVCNPYYPIFSKAFKFAGAAVEFLPMKEEFDYLIQFDDINPKLAKKAKFMIVSYPNNPTGALATDDFYKKMIQFAKKYNILVIHDNAYSEIVFDGKQQKSFLSYPGAKDVGIELNSFSKTYGMAGARLGVCVGNEEIMSIYRKLKANMDYGIFLPVQYAGIKALRLGADSIEKTCSIYEVRRDLLVKLFSDVGWSIKKNKATMFVWARIPESFDDDIDFFKTLLDETGIVTTPGSFFGTMGKRYVRLALVQNEKVIVEAANRIKESNLFK